MRERVVGDDEEPEDIECAASLLWPWQSSCRCLFGHSVTGTSPTGAPGPETQNVNSLGDFFGAPPPAFLGTSLKPREQGGAPEANAPVVALSWLGRG